MFVLHKLDGFFVHLFNGFYIIYQGEWNWIGWRRVEWVIEVHFWTGIIEIVTIPSHNLKTLGREKDSGACLDEQRRSTLTFDLSGNGFRSYFKGL